MLWDGLTVLADSLFSRHDICILCLYCQNGSQVLCVAIKSNAFKLQRARWIFTITILDSEVVRMSSKMDVSLCVCVIFPESQMVQMSLVRAEPLSLFCYKQVEECEGERSAESGKNCTKGSLLETNAKHLIHF